MTMQTKTKVGASALTANHSETSKGLRVKTAVKAGLAPPPISGGTLLATTRNHQRDAGQRAAGQRGRSECSSRDRGDGTGNIAATLQVRSGTRRIHSAGCRYRRLLCRCRKE